MDSKSKQELYDLDWGALLPHLYAYANSRHKYIGELGSVAPEDLVNEAVSKVLYGKRKWDSKKHPDILIFMKSVIKSIASHTYSSIKANKELVNKKAEENSENIAQREFDEQNTDRLCQDYLDEIENRIKGDDDLLLLFLEMQGGNFSDIDLAKVLGIDIEVVRNLKRRLRRKIVDLKNQWEENAKEAKKIEK